MGLSESKKTIANNLTTSRCINYPLSDENFLHPISIVEKQINEQFDRLYSQSRNVLLVATDTHKLYSIHHISQYLKRFTKSNDFNYFSQSIVDVVTERLDAINPYEYTVPNTDSVSVDSYISSRNTTQCEVLKQPHALTNVIPTSDNDDGRDRDAEIL